MQYISFSRLIIKNLFLGYFTTPQNKRHDVLRAIGGVLMFTQDDFEKVSYALQYIHVFAIFAQRKFA